MARFYALDEKLDVRTSLLVGLQHVMAMFVGIITPPIIVAGAVGLDAQQTGFLISMTLLASGIGTFIQVKRFGPVGSGLLSVQGTSFVCVPLGVDAGLAGGLPLIFGMAIACAPIQLVLSRCVSVARGLFPPLVTGAVVVLIGLSLVKVGIRDLAGGVGAKDFGSASNIGLGLLVTALVIIFNQFGRGLMKTVSVAGGLVVGYLLAALLGRVDFTAVGNAAVLTVPEPFKYGLDFRWSYVIPWVIAYFVITMESIGDTTATAAVSRQPVSGNVFFARVQGSILANSVGSVISGALNAMPCSTFSQNNGVIRLSGVASRRAGFAVAAILVTLGFFPKVGALISVMPRPVLGGASLVLFGMVAMGGLRVIMKDGLTARSEVILAVTLALGLGINMVPGALAHAITFEPIKIVFESGLAVGTLAAVFLNLVLPKEAPEPPEPVCAPTAQRCTELSEGSAVTALSQS